MKKQACPLCFSDASFEFTSNPSGKFFSCLNCTEFFIDASSEKYIEDLPEVTKTELKHWNDVHRPGEEIPHSGIYFCTGCNKEIACNEGDPFPPQNHSQHSHSAPPIRWKLLVKTE